MTSVWLNNWIFVKKMINKIMILMKNKNIIRRNHCSILNSNRKITWFSFSSIICKWSLFHRCKSECSNNLDIKKIKKQINKYKITQKQSLKNNNNNSKVKQKQARLSIKQTKKNKMIINHKKFNKAVLLSRILQILKIYKNKINT